jgi:tRNA nucleotidyltransferase (CCA-adding enzyme)
VHDLGKGTTPAEHWPRHHGHEARSAELAHEVSERLRVPNECRELAELTAREHGNVHRSDTLNAAAVVRLFDRCDAWRRPDRFAGLLLACECDKRGRLGFEGRDYTPRSRLAAALQAALRVDTAEAARLAAERGQRGPAIGQAVQRARIAAVAAALPDGRGESGPDEPQETT